jgi:hypothetical protein
MVVCEGCGVIVESRHEEGAIRARRCPSCGARHLQLIDQDCVYCHCCGDCLVCEVFCYCDSGECACGRKRAEGYDT